MGKISLTCQARPRLQEIRRIRNADTSTSKSSGFSRLPIIVTIVLVIVFFAVIFYGLTSRGLYFRREAGVDGGSSNSASTYVAQLRIPTIATSVMEPSGAFSDLSLLA
ncbi:hypothetical protein [Bradyrhizobium sp. USDA 10063]